MMDSSLMYDGYLLGDSAYPSLNWLVPPFKDNGRLTTIQKKFNTLHSSHRMVIEHGFGVLKGRWRRLYHFQNVNINFITKATISAVVLHNICIDSNDLSEPHEYFHMKKRPLMFFDPQDLSSRTPIDRRQSVFNGIYGIK